MFFSTCANLCLFILIISLLCLVSLILAVQLVVAVFVTVIKCRSLYVVTVRASKRFFYFGLKPVYLLQKNSICTVKTVFKSKAIF